METLQSNINPDAPDFKTNVDHHRALANELKQSSRAFVKVAYKESGEDVREVEICPTRPSATLPKSIMNILAATPILLVDLGRAG